MKINEVCALIVTFNPSPRKLQQIVASLQGQVSKVLIVDNSIDQGWQGDYSECGGIASSTAKVVAMRGNTGLGAAQNTGVRWAKIHGFDKVLILDQDSIPGPEMVAELCCALDGTGSPRIAAAGPCFNNPATGYTSSFIRYGGLFFQRITPAEVVAPSCDVDFLISSGSLVSLRAFDEVGEMDEGLFIDHVDTDWSLRARGKGYRLLGVPAATMQHELGDDCLTLWFGKTLNFPVRQPYRSYYCFRNSVLLYRKGDAPFKWKVNEFCRLLVVFGVTCCFMPQKFLHLKMIMKGVFDGLSGVTGRRVQPL